MVLKPQDVVVLVKLLQYPTRRPPYSEIAADLFLSASEVHAAVRRARSAGLLGSGDGEKPNRSALEEFLVHGLKYAFPPRRGELSRGMPTGFAAAPLKTHILQGDEPVPVWPFAEGEARGYSLEPLYRTVPQAALRDPYLYEMLALIDAIRDGRSRERALAEKELAARLRLPMNHAES